MMIGRIVIAAAMMAGASLGAAPAMAVASQIGLPTDILTLEFRPSPMIGLETVDPAPAADAAARPLRPLPVSTTPSPRPATRLRKKVV